MAKLVEVSQFKDNLNCVRITKYDVPDLEAIWIEVTSISQRLLVSCVYRPPDRTGFFGKFHGVVEKMWQSKKDVVIVGDLKVDHLSFNWNGSKLKRIFQSVIHNPTRIAATLSTLLDLILTNNLPKTFKSGVSDYTIVDHKFVFTVSMFKKQNEEMYTFKKLTASKTGFQHELENAPWRVFSVFDNVDNVTWVWESMYKDIRDGYVSSREAKNRKFSLPWINSVMQKAINKMYKLPGACDGSPLTANTWARYKHARNEVTKLLRNAEALRWKERFAESKDSISFWKSVAYRNMHLKRNDEKLVNEYEKAERLNHFFH